MLRRRIENIRRECKEGKKCTVLKATQGEAEEVWTKEGREERKERGRTMEESENEYGIFGQGEKGKKKGNGWREGGRERGTRKQLLSRVWPDKKGNEFYESSPTTFPCRSVVDNRHVSRLFQPSVTLPTHPPYHADHPELSIEKKR